MNLQNPKKFKMLVDQAHEVALNVLRPVSRKYDKAEHAYPKELDMLSSLVDGMNEGGEGMNAGAAGAGKRSDNEEQGNRNGTNMSTALSIIEMCYGDTGLLLSMPRQGLGNSAIAATNGRVLSKVSMTPAKPLAMSTSALPSKFSAGTRQSMKLMTAVSEALIPNLCSRRSTFMPAVPLGTTKDLMAARPSFLSNVAHTTTESARSPEVTKIFSPLRI